jgi:hypothetical protein
MQTEKLIEAIEIAKDIIDYCGGDAWERECTQEARDRFQEIYEELFPKQEQSPKIVISKHDWRCDICKITMPKGNRESHVNGKKHKAMEKCNIGKQNVNEELGVDMIMRERLIERAVKNLREFGYPGANSENIITDQVYSMFFDSMLKENIGHGADEIIKSLRDEIALNQKC